MGFKYKTVAFTWNKKRGFMGKWTVKQCEICLLATKGTAHKLLKSFKEIKDHAIAFAKDQGFKVRIAMQDAEKAADPEEYREYIETHIDYIRTAKETIKLVDEDQIRIRNEIKDVRRNGTWHERLQAKIKARQQKKN